MQSLHDGRLVRVHAQTRGRVETFIRCKMRLKNALE